MMGRRPGMYVYVCMDVWVWMGVCAAGGRGTYVVLWRAPFEEDPPAMVVCVRLSGGEVSRWRCGGFNGRSGERMASLENGRGKAWRELSASGMVGETSATHGTRVCPGDNVMRGAS